MHWQTFALGLAGSRNAEGVLVEHGFVVVVVTIVAVVSERKVASIVAHCAYWMNLYVDETQSEF